MKLSSAVFVVAALAATLWLSDESIAYPTDEYDRTGIRRLKYQQDSDQGIHSGTKLVPGAKWPSSFIKLRMREQGRDYELTKTTVKDSALQKALEKVLKEWSWRKYNVAILDISDPAHPRFAGVNEHVSQTPGSVAKVLVAAGMFEQLRVRFPDDVAARERMLRNHVVAADDWVMKDTHEVPVISGAKLDKSVQRRVAVGDTFSLWEWMDHALSASNNSAAAMTWREAMLMKLLAGEYPPSKYGPELWAKFSRKAMTVASFDVVDKPLLDAGISPEEFRLRLYFARGASKYVGSNTCGATAFTMSQWMLRVEQGRMVDEWSSRELKKMLYLTRRRARYLYTHKLDNFGAFFKSGSFYRFTANAVSHAKYEGDEINVLNSLIEIDTSLSPTPPPSPTVTVATVVTNAAEQLASNPASSGAESTPVPAKANLESVKAPHIYIVAVMSNELKRNAAMDHARLAEAVHVIVTAPADAPAAIPSSPDAVKVPDLQDPAEAEDG